MKTNVGKIVRRDMRKYRNTFEFWSGSDITELGMHRGKPIYEVKSDRVIHCSGFAFSAVCLSLTESKYLVVVDELFKNSPEYVQNFNRCHEIGHIKLSHVDSVSGSNLKNYIKRVLGIGKQSRNEFEADAYSAAKVGYDTAIKAITWILDNYNFGFFGNREFKRRLRVLKNSAAR